MPRRPSIIQQLVDAQVEVNRAVFEMNKPGLLPPDNREPELRYVMRCVSGAFANLETVFEKLDSADVRAFSDREMKKWERGR